jgi:hypothetical protein
LFQLAFASRQLKQDQRGLLLDVRLLDGLSRDVHPPNDIVDDWLVRRPDV